MLLVLTGLLTVVGGFMALAFWAGWRHGLFARQLLGTCFWAGACVSLAISLAPERQLAGSNGAVALDDMPLSLTFDAPLDGRQIYVGLQGAPRNGWAGFEIEVADPDGALLGTRVLGIERYEGIAQGLPWTEGSGYDSLSFRPSLSGPHTVTVSLNEFEPWQGAAQHAPPKEIEVMVYARRGAAVWPTLATSLFGAMWLFARSGDTRYRSGADATPRFGSA